MVIAVYYVRNGTE